MHHVTVNKMCCLARCAAAVGENLHWVSNAGVNWWFAQNLVHGLAQSSSYRTKIRQTWRSWWWQYALSRSFETSESILWHRSQWKRCRIAWSCLRFVYVLGKVGCRAHIRLPTIKRIVPITHWTSVQHGDVLSWTRNRIVQATKPVRVKRQLMRWEDCRQRPIQFRSTRFDQFERSTQDTVVEKSFAWQMQRMARGCNNSVPWQFRFERRNTTKTMVLSLLLLVPSACIDRATSTLLGTDLESWVCPEIYKMRCRILW